jgi:DNA adenine methylase
VKKQFGMSTKKKKRRPRVIELSRDRITIQTGSKGDGVQSRDLVQPMLKPVIKWAGGKQWLAAAAPHLIPKQFAGRYYEPFLGGGAFFFALSPALATVSDRNEALIKMYRALRSDTEGVIELLSRYPHEKEFYYRIRKRLPSSIRSIATRFLYLNKTCWNGLYRVNQKNIFNTPFGNFENPTICDRDRIRRAARLLRRVSLRDGDFEKITGDAKRGDFVYFDPPYITGHKYNGFLKYNAPLFSWDDQKRLARLANKLSDVGVHVLVSNADQGTVVDLYKGFNYYRVTRRSLIGGNVSSRGTVVEALFSNYPILGCDSEVI